MTLYADDGFLAQNNDNADSIDASRIGNDGPWRARIAPVRGDAAYWLSSREARRDFSLTLRVYNPQRDFRASEDTLPVLTHRLLRGGALMSGVGKYVWAALAMAVVDALDRDLHGAARADGRRDQALERRRRLQCVARRRSRHARNRARSCAPRPISPIPPASTI